MKEKEKSGWLVVVNPNAGVGKGAKDWKVIARLLEKQGIVYKPVFTKRRLHAMEMVEENISKGYRKFIVVGGDGTMNEAVNGIFNQTAMPTTDITLAMIAVGTGNDWVRTYNIPTDYKQVVKVLKKEQTMLQDAGLVKYSHESGTKERYFINMAGLGFDGLVAQKTNHDKDRGRTNPFVYLKNLVYSLFSYKASQCRVLVDGHEVNDKVFSLSVGIGQYNGGGMHQAPTALTDDGLFDLTLIKDMSKWSVVTSLKSLYDGTIGKHKRVITLQGKHIFIDATPPVLLETDGESLGQSPFEFEIIPKSIRVIINSNQEKNSDK